MKRVSGARAAYVDCLEISLPVSALGDEFTVGKHEVDFYFVIVKGGLEAERIPWSFDLKFVFDPEDFDLENWSI
jgi:hypothetical protein